MSKTYLLTYSPTTAQHRHQLRGFALYGDGKYFHLLMLQAVAWLAKYSEEQNIEHHRTTNGSKADSEKRLHTAHYRDDEVGPGNYPV